MGKKKNKIVLSDKELEPTTIGFLDTNKKGPVALIILFLIFIAFAIFLPNITGYINKLLGKDTTPIVIPNTEPEEKEEEIEEEIVMYDLTEDLKFSIGDLEFSSFSKNESIGKYYLSFTITNNGVSSVNFATSKYFIEIYSAENTLLNRHIFTSTTPTVGPNGTARMSIELTEQEYNNIAKLLISLKTEKDYPDYIINFNDKDEYIFYCTKSNNTVSYTFDKNENITKIKDTVNAQNDGTTTYMTALSLYQARTVNYNNKVGVSSSLVEVSTGFTATTEIDMKTASISELNNENYYDSKTAPKIIKFEMESRGYSCK